ncbi:type II secretion system F family protein [Castellaniella sp.]|uniref:type II secretion system F family protein n=1 Tax=Castellaniella sp. TaxID=1955812 RepID=UPI002AFF13E3|nr:type II secretion system F family protein [Castellaniella sp.]
MSTIDVITLIVFAAAILTGLALLVLADWRRKRPRQRMRERLLAVSGASRSQLQAKVVADLQRAQAEARRRRRRQALGSLGYYLNRLDTVAGAGGGRRLGLTTGLLSLTATALLVLGVLPMAWWTALLAIVVVPTLLALMFYRSLVSRFRKRFLNQLPDAMDTIVRASRAGIPVTQSIRNVGLQFEAPLGPEFRKMGDSLLLGNDLEDVLDDAVLRVELPDFSFFSVCVLLQRESGGSVVEALENLAGIIRARRDLGLKTKALTAETRLSGLVLSLLPFIIVGMLYFVNRAYVEVLFTTETGRILLWTAAGMLCLGILAIRYLSRLEV